MEDVELLGVQLFASPPGEPRSRRPTDVLLAATSVVAIGLAAAIAAIGHDLERAWADLLAALPHLIDAVWRGALWLPLAWGAVLVGIAVARRRPTLARDLFLAAAVALTAAVALGLVATDDGWAPLRRFADAPPSFPSGVISVSSAVLIVASPHLTRPFRNLGRWLLTGQVIGAMLLGNAFISGVIAATAVGALAAAVVHLALGSPGGRPTPARIRLALAGLGHTVTDLSITGMHAGGVVRYAGCDDVGPIAVKVYGRDAWDGQMLSTMWRLLWYRGAARSARSVRLSRVALVEHEAFVILLAERAGVRVPHVVTAGSAGRGDALVAVRADGQPLRENLGGPYEVAVLRPGAIDDLWVELDRLHDAGLTHGRLDLDRVVVHDDASLGFGDLSS
ncbi:MAG: hypothetical protein ACK5OX_12765, partial [Desertimonas sp.]